MWSGENNDRICRAKVAWDSLILPLKQGGVKLLDHELRIQALLVKLFIRGLMLGDAPWRALIQHRINNIHFKKGGEWPPHIQFILYATSIRTKGSSLWLGIWKAWISIRHQLFFQQPTTPEAIIRQNIFWNGELLDKAENMFGDSAYGYGCTWMRRKIIQVGDLWDPCSEQVEGNPGAGAHSPQPTAHRPQERHLAGYPNHIETRSRNPVRTLRMASHHQPGRKGKFHLSAALPGLGLTLCTNQS